MILTLFGKFLRKLLLEHDSYDALPQLVGCVKDLAALGAEVPAAGKFLEGLARFDIVGDNEFAQEGLTLADITTLFSSNLYVHYRRRRLLARFRVSARSPRRGPPQAPLRALFRKGFAADHRRYRTPSEGDLEH